MPIDFVPRQAGTYQLPKMGVLRDAYRQAVRNAGGNPNFQSAIEVGVPTPPKPLMNVQAGRISAEGPNIINEALKMPAYSLEAPLRPLNQATGGGLGEFLAGAWNTLKGVPVLGAPLHGIEAVGGILEVSNKAARAFANQSLAQQLAAVAGKPDSFVFNDGQGHRWTAGQIRAKAQERWSINEFTGEEMSLAALEARARNNPWDFGEFRTNENGIVDFLTQAVVDPTNLALLGGGKLLGLGANAVRAAGWTKPAVVSRMVGAPRVGYGMLQSLGRATVQTKRGAAFMDEMSAARAILEGQFAQHATLAGTLRAASWVMRGLYVPGRAANIAKGMNPVKATTVAYMRGGMQQQLATNAVEQIAGAANGLMQDSALEGTAADAITGFLHDSLNKLNNDHFLSDNEAFYISALFAPWGQAIADIPAGVKRTRTANGLPRYADDTLYHLKEEMRKNYGVKFGYEELFIKIGMGDVAAGRRAWEWAVDHFEALKASNQISDFGQRTAGLEDMARRVVLLTKTVVDDVIAKREVGALQPNSLADYIVEQFKHGPLDEAGERLAHEFELTPDILLEGIGRLHRAYEAIAPQLAEMGGLQLAQGAPLTKEILDSLVNRLVDLPGDEIVPREVAARIMAEGPALVYAEGEFWSAFSSTLGQRQHSGKWFRQNGPAEGVTVKELRERLMTFRDSTPSAEELYHESIAAAKNTTKIDPGNTLVSEPPYPMPEKLARRRLINTGRVRQLSQVAAALRKIRDAEFFKNGKPRLAAAKELVGPKGTTFKRTGKNTMTSEDGLSFTVSDDGVLSMRRNEVRQSREAQMLEQEGLEELREARDMGVTGRPGSVAFEYNGLERFWRTFDDDGLPAGIAIVQRDGTGTIAVLPEVLNAGHIRDRLREHMANAGWDPEDFGYVVETLAVDPEALVLGVQNGGRVMVAPREQGGILAEHGFVEVASIKGVTERTIVDPGPKPVRPPDYDPPEPGSFEDQFGFPKEEYGPDIYDNLDAVDADIVWEDGIPLLKQGSPSEAAAKNVFETWADEVEQWEKDMARAVGMGVVSPEEAAMRGWYEYDDLQRAGSEPYYYATSHYDEIMRDGIKTRDESGGTGLGGGPSNTISTTKNKRAAEIVAEGKREAILVAQGKVTIDDLLLRASKGEPLKNGMGTTPSFLRKFIEALAYRVDRGMKPDGLEVRRTGREIVRAWRQDPTSVTPEEVFGVYRVFLAIRERVGGVNDPLFWEPDVAHLAKGNPDNVGVITLRAKPGTVVARHGDAWLDEWKGFLTEQFNIEGRVTAGMDMATYAYRGGDTTRILENKPGFAPYKPSKKNVASVKAGINAARRVADQGSLVYPSMEGIGPSLTKANRALNPDARRAELNGLIEAAETQRKYLVKQISESDRIAMELIGLEASTATLGQWFSRATKSQIDNVLEMVKTVNRDFPELSVREGPGHFIDPRADRFSTLMTHRNIYRRLAFDYGYLSPLNFLYTSLLSPQNARWLGKQTQTEIHNLLAQVGWKTGESEKLMALMRDRINESRSFPGSVGEKTGTHLFRTIRALPDGVVQSLMEQAAPGKSARVLERWGSPQKMFTEAGQRLMRNASRKARMGGKVDPLSRAVDNAFRIWQYTPGLSTLSSATHYGTKFIYPLLRFGLDPFYHLMNVIEPDMYGISMEGTRASRLRKHIVPEEQSARAAELNSLTSVPPGGLQSKELPTDLLMADIGAYTMPRNIRPILERHFDIKRAESYRDFFRGLKDDDPIAVILREQFGDDVDDWAKSFDELMYGWTTKGPEGTVVEASNKAFEGLSREERKRLLPFVERLSSRHRGQYNDLVNLYVGRMNRTQLERIFDNFFLFWPLSYQIKATKWLAGIMFNKIGGVQTNAAGAYMYDEYRQRWERMLANDPGFKAWTEDNDGFMFAFEMMFPMTPEGVGVSLSRPTRYVGSWIADGLEIPADIKETALGNYPRVKTIPDMLVASAAVGPVRTERLFRQIMNGFGVPGFTYDEFNGVGRSGSIQFNP